MKLLFLFLILIQGSFSYKAIIFTFHDSGSHQGSISKLFLKLAKDGYNIDVFDTTSKTLPSYGPNISVIDGRTDFIPRLIYNVSELVWKSFPDSTSLVRLYNIGDLYLKSLIEQKPEIVSQVLSENYDIVILGDIFSTHGIWFAETLKRTKNIPFIFYGTTLQLHYANSALGFGRHYLSRPCPEGDIKRRGKDVFDLNSFWIRLSTFQSAFGEHFALGNFADFVIPTLKSLASPKFDFVKFHKESSFFLSEAFDRLGLPLSEVNDYKGVGPNCPKVGKLPSNLETFVNDPKSKGTIFVAFGSHAKWDIAPKYITNAFFEAFSNLTDYRFIFSFNGKIKSSVPKHILILEWSPQKEILNHPKTKIFISHSGLKSTTEAICAAIPIIFMPLYAEQKANSQFLTYFGHAETLDKFSVSAKDVIEAIERIEINFPKRKQKMEKLKRLYLDRIINPMDEASFYVTKVIKANKGNGRLPFKRVSIEESWFIFLSFDLFALLIAFVFIIAK